MQHAKPITKIDDSTLKSDLKNYVNEMQSIPLEVYYVFRDEIVNDLGKKKEAFRK